ncbi:hypothetical protein CG724_19035 [Streptomyces sp. CB02120-2]|nr:hypothetical protein CG724_19035 [Streptomyces sp. CB02120-2]
MVSMAACGVSVRRPSPSPSRRSRDHMSQPPLSRAIKGPEAGAGAPLFARSPVGVTLTRCRALARGSARHRGGRARA